MSRFMQIALIGIVAGSIAGSVRAQERPEEADIREGHRLAVKICDYCHVAASDQQFLPILRPPGPRFEAIANRPGVTAESLRTFFVTTHSTLATPKNMPNPQLTEDQVRVVVSYILSLRRPRWAPARPR
jgi:hypothetical protein